MAISGTQYRLLKRIQHVLPRGGTVLEIGEANWYGDDEPDFPCRDKTNLFTVAKDMYRHLFAPRRIVSIDLNGTLEALRHDLNGPIPCEELFDLCINHGTAEHIFNVSQVFVTMHDRTKDGGLMIHESPFTGWIDHGFYCLHPTLFYDVAAANCYEIVLLAVEEIVSRTIHILDSRDGVVELVKSCQLPLNALLFSVFRKFGNQPFVIPVQGYYARTLSDAGQMAWRELR